MDKNTENLERILREMVGNAGNISKVASVGQEVTDILNKITRETEERKREEEKKNAAHIAKVAERNKHIATVGHSKYYHHDYILNTSAIDLDYAIAALMIVLDNIIDHWSAEDMREMEKLTRKDFEECIGVLKATNKFCDALDKLAKNANEDESLDQTMEDAYETISNWLKDMKF